MIMIGETKVAAILTQLGLTVVGEPQTPKEGRIAKNFLVETLEYGLLLVRLYPPSFDKAQVGFEKRAIEFLGERGIKVPCLANLSLDDKFEGWHGFAYTVLDGKCLSLDELTEDIVAQAGTQLATMVSAAREYVPNGTEPDGDLEFIDRILSKFQKSCTAEGDHPVMHELFSQIRSNTLKSALLETPQGIAHADYFFENVLVKGGQVVGVIDFGDSYYGSLLMDVGTGAMEFSVMEDGTWNTAFFRTFIQQFSEWLLSNGIGFALLKEVLLANCVRFAAHTLNLAVDSGEIPDITQNPYVQRFLALKGLSLPQQLEHEFLRACSTKIRS
jgi:Ser/Thr protein kinase RdoA (MazF antagonist)